MECTAQKSGDDLDVAVMGMDVDQDADGINAMGAQNRGAPRRQQGNNANWQGQQGGARKRDFQPVNKADQETGRPAWVTTRDMKPDECFNCAMRGHMANTCIVPVHKQRWKRKVGEINLERAGQGAGAPRGGGAPRERGYKKASVNGVEFEVPEGYSLTPVQQPAAAGINSVEQHCGSGVRAPEHGQAVAQFHGYQPGVQSGHGGGGGYQDFDAHSQQGYAQSPHF